MKDNDLDFDGALKLTEWHPSMWDDKAWQKNKDAFKFALALAKEIQAGTVTDEMIERVYDNVDQEGHSFVS